MQPLNLGLVYPKKCFVTYSSLAFPYFLNTAVSVLHLQQQPPYLSI